MSVRKDTAKNVQVQLFALKLLTRVGYLALICTDLGNYVQYFWQPTGAEL